MSFKPFLSQTVSLSGTGADAPATLAASASLMTNYEAARPVDARHRVRTVEDKNGDPIIFSIGTDGHLFAVVRDPRQKTGWAQHDVTGPLGGTVTTFDACKVGADSFALTVCLDGVKVYLSGVLNADPQAGFWSNLSAQLTQHADGMNITKVSRLILCANADQTAATCLILASADGTHFDRYVTDTNAQGWTLMPLPQNVHRSDGADPIIDARIGVHPRHSLLGSYVLYKVGADVALTFVSIDKIRGKTFSFGFETVPTGAQALATVRRPGSAGTDLYLAADQLYEYSADYQASPKHGAPPTTVAQLGPADAETEIEALADDTTTALWYLRDGQLSYVARQADKWSTPIVLKAHDVGQIAAMRNSVRRTNELVELTANNTLSYQYQDPSTTLWREIEIPLHDTGKALPFSCYATVLMLTDAAGGACKNMQVNLSATNWCLATVNGQTHTLAPSEGGKVSVSTDVTGRLTILTRTSGAASPMLTLSSEQFSQVVDIGPQAVLHNNLHSYSSSGAFSGAKTQSGAPVIGAGSKIGAGELASATTALVQAGHTAASNLLNVRAPGAGPSDRISAARLPADNAPLAMSRQSDGTWARVDALPEGIFDKLDAAFGDVMHSITNGLEKVGHWAIDGLEFTLHLAGKVGTFVLDTLEKVGQALTWLLSEIEMGIEKLIDWLGQLLGFDDALELKAVIENSVDKLFDWTVENFASVKSDIDGALTHAQTTLGKTLVLPEDLSTKTPMSFLQDQKGKNQSKLADAGFDLPVHSPGGSFGVYHLLHSVGSLGGDVSAAITDPLKGFIQTVGEQATGLAKETKDTVKTLVEGIEAGTLSLGDIISHVTGELAASAIAIARTTVDRAGSILADLVQAIKSVLNARIELPFISGLYSFITKSSPPSLLSGFALLISVPVATILDAFGQKQLIGQLKPLSNTALSPSAFFALATGGSATALAASEDAPGTLQLVLADVFGALSIVCELIDFAMEEVNILLNEVGTIVAIGKLITATLLWITEIPINPDPFGDMVSSLGSSVWIVNFIALSGPVVEFVPDLGGAVSGAIGVLIGITLLVVETTEGIMELIDAHGATDIVLDSIALVESVVSQLVNVGIGTVILIDELWPEAIGRVVMKAIGMILALWVVLKTVLDAGRLGYVLIFDRERPYA